MAFVRSFSSVNALVILEVNFKSKGLGALFTLERLFFVVSFDVPVENSLIGECGFTLLALKWSLSSVSCPNVNFQVTLIPECGGAKEALVWF